MTSRGSSAQLPPSGPSMASSRGVYLRSARVGQAMEDVAPMMLHCLFAMLSTAAAMHLLATFGLVSRASCCCGSEACDTYSWCHVWQDARSLAYVCLGTLYYMRYGVGTEGHSLTDRTEKGGILSSCFGDSVTR
eukprot:CAMPEP_0171163800 /NCGR_PEP_ID=MMETSP0790-20130122/5336_1 /TAXON_ID=2925 /ORGANISM="Alexandrium catenella, Strain OF101" /LENGTH=133 /DNA_ID=CAMNT_0011628529 /DNA_START=89 /DNA_END=491 /DNA_ORIENTATION=+